MIKRKILFLVLILLLLTGCWDQMAIEELGFIVGSAVDVTDKKENGQYLLTLTNQFVVPAGLGAPMQGGGEQKAYANLSASGVSMVEISRKMGGLSSQVPSYEHEKIIVISNEVAETPLLFGNIMDIFLRNPKMRRSIKVMIADGKAKKILSNKPESEKIPAIYIDTLMENSFRSALEIEPVKVGRIHEYILDKTSYVLPRVIPVESGIEYEGVAVFQGYDNRMVGILNGEETKGLNLITGGVQEGIINVELGHDVLTFEIENVKSEMRVNTDDIKHVDVSIGMHVEGIITETFGSENFMKKQIVSEIEKLVSEQVEKRAKQSIKKAQKELKTDVFGIGNRIKEHHFAQWEQIKKNWDHGENYFSNVTFHVHASTKIRSAGSVNKTKHK